MQAIYQARVFKKSNSVMDFFDEFIEKQKIKLAEMIKQEPMPHDLMPQKPKPQKPKLQEVMPIPSIMPKISRLHKLPFWGRTKG